MKIKIGNRNYNMIPLVAVIAVLVLVGSAVVGVLGGAGLFGEITTQGYNVDTSTDNYKFRMPSGGNHRYFEGQVSIEGYPDWEISCPTQYATAWYGNEDSEPIFFQGAIKMHRMTRTKENNQRIPYNLVRDYHWKIYFNGQLVAWKGGYDSSVIEIHQQAAQTKDGNFFSPDSWLRGDQVPSDGYYDDDCGWAQDVAGANPEVIGRNTRYIEGSTHPSKAGLLYTDMGIITLKGPKTGYMRFELWAENRAMKEGEKCDMWLGDWCKSEEENDGHWGLVQVDEVKLLSGKGTVRISPDNSLESEGKQIITNSENQVTTGSTYELYHFEEGSTATIHYQTGASGVSSDSNGGNSGNSGSSDGDSNEGGGIGNVDSQSDKWRITVTRVSGSLEPLLEEYVDDNSRGSIPWTIEEGTFRTGGSNQFVVTLNNGLFDQDEQVTCIVDSSENMAPAPDVDISPGTRPTVGQTVNMEITGAENENTNKPISHFNAIIKYGAHTTDYVASFRPGYQIAAQPSAGNTYKANLEFVVRQKETIYYTIWSTDTDGRDGYYAEGSLEPEDEPMYSITFKVTDAQSGKNVDGATVYFGNQEKTTDDGYASFAVRGGKYSYMVTEQGYHSVKVDSYYTEENDIINVQLVPVGSSTGDDDDDGGDGDGDGIGEISDEQTVTVTCYNDDDWDYIEGAQVTIGSQTETTNAEGKADFSFDTLSAKDVTVTASGFESFSESRTLQDFESGFIWVYLTPTAQQGDDDTGDGEDEDEETQTTTSGAKVQFKVWSTQSNTVVSDVLISFDSFSATTDSRGMATFENVPHDTYTATLTARGYEDKEKEIIVEGYTSTWVWLDETTEDVEQETPEDTNPDEELNAFTVSVTNGNDNTIILVGGAKQYGSDATYQLAEGQYTLTVGRGGYKTHTSIVNIPDETTKTITLEEEDEDANKVPDAVKDPYSTTQDLDGDGIVNSEDDDIDGDGVPNDEDLDPTDPDVGLEEGGFDFINLFGGNTLMILLSVILIAVVGVGYFVYFKRKK